MTMKRKQGIAWTEDTWNPSTGCDRVSPGCDNCYALTLAERLKTMGNPKYQNDGEPPRSGPGFGFTIHPDTLDIPRRWQRPRFVFVNSMSDLFHEDMPIGFLQSIFDTMNETPRHTYQVLTKRSQRLKKMADQFTWTPNIWMGVSVENQKYSFRSRHLAETEGPALRFLSVEPLIGEVPDLPLDNIDWVIVGAESGNGARTMEHDWVRDIRDQILARPEDSRPAFFYKQDALHGRKLELPELDGVVWDEMPEKVEPYRQAML
jgi:protein gp37